MKLWLLGGCCAVSYFFGVPNSLKNTAALTNKILNLLFVSEPPHVLAMIVSVLVIPVVLGNQTT